MNRVISQPALEASIALVKKLDAIIALTQKMMDAEKARRWQILELIRANATGYKPMLAVLKDHIDRGGVPKYHIYPSDYPTLKIYRELTKEKEE